MIRRVLYALALLTVGAGLGAVGWWAVSTVVLAPEADDEDQPPPTVSATEGTVGRSLTLAAEAARSRDPLPATTASGRLTSLPADPRVLEAGDVAFEVGLRPVVVADGDVPSFRDLARGATGADVAQLQQLLDGLGHDLEADGEFGAATEAAVRDWQEDLGLERTGVVGADDVLFVPELPVTAVPAEDLAVGDTVSPDMVVLDRVSPTPRFTIQISTEQTELVPLDAAVVVDPAESAWEAQIAERIAGTGPAQESIDLVLEGAGGPVCPEPCDEVSPTGETEVFPAEIVVVPETTGTVVPVSALQISEDGAASVALDSGGAAPVTVLAQAEGRAVVEGIEPGEVVRVFGRDDAEGPG